MEGGTVEAHGLLGYSPHPAATTAFTHSPSDIHYIAGHSTNYRPAGSTHDGRRFGAGTIDFTATEEEGRGWQGQID
jgi:hypothetical protein